MKHPIAHVLVTAVELALLAAWLAYDVEGAGNLYRALLATPLVVSLLVLSDKVIADEAKAPAEPDAVTAVAILYYAVAALSLFWTAHFAWGGIAVWCWACREFKRDQAAKLRAAAARTADAHRQPEPTVVP